MNVRGASANVAPNKKTGFGSSIQHVFSITAPEGSSGKKKFKVGIRYLFRNSIQDRVYFLLGKNEADVNSWINAINSINIPSVSSSSSSGSLPLRVLITGSILETGINTKGATGNVGQAVVEFLSKKPSVQIRVTSRDPSKSLDLFKFATFSFFLDSKDLSMLKL